MKNIKLLHIGLGKCGSNFLEAFFDKVSIGMGIQKIKFNDLIDIKKIKFHYLENDSNLEKKLPQNYILSKRSLFSKRWEFNQINESFYHIKRNFSSDTAILIILRNPYDLLNSIYLQSIQVHDCLKPDEFFYIEKNKIQRKKNKFNLYNFDYKLLVSLYKSYFKNVIIIKYENIHKFDYLNKIFNFQNDDYEREFNNLKRNFFNRSISKTGVNFTLFLNNFINLKKFQRLIKKNITYSPNFFLKLKNRILYQFLIREFFQNKFDKIFKYKKYFIDKSCIPIDIDKMVKDYDQTDYNSIK